MERILIAGATGYLGGFVSREFKEQGYYTRVLVRNKSKFKNMKLPADEIFTAEATEKSSLERSCQGIDVVFSSIGITRQKDGLTYMDVDYKANLNLLEEARKSKVKKFIYVSVLNGDQMRDLKMCEAKEKFVDELKGSGMDYCIIRPNGYFSDMGEFFEMANRGTVFLIGDGQHKINPIHGSDLAKICVNAVHSDKNEISVGGPEILTHLQIAEIAFNVLDKKNKTFLIPGWIGFIMLSLMRTFTGSKTYGPVEFFMRVLSRDMIGEKLGDHMLKNYFIELKNL